MVGPAAAGVLDLRPCPCARQAAECPTGSRRSDRSAQTQQAERSGVVQERDQADPPAVEAVDEEGEASVADRLRKSASAAFTSAGTSICVAETPR
jgi:hypothetical protein